MPVDIEAEFSGLDKFYPGSKRQRRQPAASVDVRDDVAWDAHPIVKPFGGQPTEFFTVGALAAALGKSVITIRLWERNAYIPRSPYRLPSHKRSGGLAFSRSDTVPGKRVFTRALVEAAVEEFGKRDLLGAARVEWKQHVDLTIALVERWSAITDSTT